MNVKELLLHGDKRFQKEIFSNCSSSSDEGSIEGAMLLRKELELRHKRVISNSIRISKHKDYEPHHGLLECKLKRKDGMPYKFSLRRVGKYLVFEDTPEEWEYGNCPEKKDRILSVNGKKADSEHLHEDILEELGSDELMIEFGKMSDFPDSEEYVLVILNIQRYRNEPMGVTLRRRKHTMLIEDINEGPFQRWNWTNINSIIRPYDRIYTINGIVPQGAYVDKALEIFGSERDLTLIIGKLRSNPNPHHGYILFDLTLQKRGQPIGIQVKPVGSFLQILKIEKGAIANWIKKRKNNHNRYPREGDMIVIVNDVHNIDDMMIKLQECKELIITIGQAPYNNVESHLYTKKVDCEVDFEENKNDNNSKLLSN